MQTGLNIGTVVDEDSLSAVTGALTTIMSTPADQETIRHAIDALARMSRVDGVTIQNCVIKGDRKVEVHVDADEGEASVTNGDLGVGS